MTNQEQYESMIIQEPVDRNTALINAAQMIKQYCLTHNCCECPFHDSKSWEECKISSRDYLDATYPQTWDV